MQHRHEGRPLVRCDRGAVFRISRAIKGSQAHPSVARRAAQRLPDRVGESLGRHGHARRVVGAYQLDVDDGHKGTSLSGARQPAITAAIATAVASTLPLFNPATQMRPERTM